ncbi:hypothetical protein JHD47_00900 [Sulfurimonas sp. SAG-AH-194-L11]|nr:hypothetical protein [Sulfurimonas sp. SAG-AH-194-L11]MDF1876373.1 hypothetical protein [Sulfurimonas sp. SAG-AH-194-L11]
MRYLFLLLFLLFTTNLFASYKTPSDVYAESIVLKNILIELRKENKIVDKLRVVPEQKDKLPRHVLQKTLEILNKINKYREINNFGKITVPPVPSRDITPQDVYNNVERLKTELLYLVRNKVALKKSLQHLIIYTNKTLNDVYRELWSISLAFDALLGQGFTPTDVYMQSEKILNLVKFLRASQYKQDSVKKPKLKANQHPNHALYKSVELIEKINKMQKKLWIKPVPIPKIKQKVISPTEVYDSLQTVIAELNRVSRRLGIERSFDIKDIEEKKTPADVVQNLEYAILLLPSVNFSTKLNQYPKSSLQKTPNDVFALSEFILKKLEYIKVQKGILVKTKKTSYIYRLKPIHVYVKGIESLEKVAKLKRLEGFEASQVPSPPIIKITPSEVYELILRLDDELNLIYKDKGYDTNSVYKIRSFREVLGKAHYLDKTSSDVYDNLWKISYTLDSILNEDYSPNETYALAKKIQNDIHNIANHFVDKPIKIKLTHSSSKRPEDVYVESLKLLRELELIKQRGNFKSVTITLPKEDIITPTSVYNALRIISATISEINVFYDIGKAKTSQENSENKTSSDVYDVVLNTTKIISFILKDSSYED